MTASNDKNLRVALIGAGGIAGNHLTALKKIDAVEIVGLADINENTIVKRAKEFDIPSSGCFTDYEEMLEKIQPDAVSICTPNGLHAPNSIAASKAGAHVIVEKPMAMNAAEARQMIDAANAAGKKLVIGFQFRFDSRTQYLKRMADDGVFGDIFYGRVQALRRRGIPNWGVFGRKDLQGGGPMIDIGVHMLEQCHYVMGSPRPVAATGLTRTYIGDQPSTEIHTPWAGWDHETYTVEDIAVGTIRFENGAVIHIEASFAGHLEDKMDFELYGTKGGATWEDATVRTDEHGHMLNIKPGWIRDTSYPEYFPLKLGQFVEHCINDGPTIAPAEHGLMVQQMLDGVYQSAEQGGKEVAIG
ncbi:Gfo/Idh/MocA family protein [Mucisphaera calidilacus]|uniref:Putative oxidoreductase YcjS n=1 Tax=Mucisphaera calidilacus TaxID=2527982 RepID=A0A518BUQ0_9BACT|nr:Gfo/Idh/MocA family oxidoreductase [Mucisphaera calidilacus]QDU70713.1 putative oxidoreductase YcjS [Mucisphaera calidilacus]